MTSHDIRSSFIHFFTDKGHTAVPSSPVIPYEDPTLLFTNAGMNQFKDVFLGTGKRPYVRAVNSQKCIRVSGKHNDLEEVGRDGYHHTFFEMLGNWSFGDYYKAEAIAWAWELLTGVWGLDKTRLYATVYETDDEAETLWKKVTDIEHSHVLRFGKKDNFWEMGETGPCGPCSEIHIDVTADKSGGALVNAGDARVMEIWNLVFIQNNRTEDGRLEDLPAKHVDTGMGFERICAVLQNKSSNYDTDVFSPIIHRISEISGKPYEGDRNQVAMRVIADHARMLTFAMTDGALPGNEGRGYVLRRILRRAARFGRTLDLHDPFLARVIPTIVSALGDTFPEIRVQQDHVQRIVTAEEESFNATLDRGLEIFESVVERIGHSSVFPGEGAFRLYDTYGFPLDLTQLMATERGLSVDVGTFTELMEEQRTRAREAGKAEVFKSDPGFVGQIAALPPTTFVGYEHIETHASAQAVLEGKFLSLDSTPFYVESGGQVDDTGLIVAPGFKAEVVRSLKSEGRIVHEVKVLEGSLKRLVGSTVQATVDRERRMNIQRNHSATHIVHEALRRVLGTHVHQQGSLVAPDHLRFDFPHFGKITAEELRDIEQMTNDKIRENIVVATEVDLPIEKARKIPDVKMFFGDKYGDTVRVVFIDESFSVEFCGGTHVARTTEIGPFKIVSEASIASGVRRIEAVTGGGLKRYVEKQFQEARTTDDQLLKLAEEAEALVRELGPSQTTVGTIERPTLGKLDLGPDIQQNLQAVEAYRRRQSEETERLAKATRELRKQLSRARVQDASQGIDELVASSKTVEGLRVVAARVEAASADELKSLGDALRNRLGSGIGVLASVIDDKVSMVCVVTDDLVSAKRLQAGPVIAAVSKIVGGGGGGRPHMATAGGRDASKLDQALAETATIVQSLLKR